MEKETESAQDYYVLFRDAKKGIKKQGEFLEKLEMQGRSISSDSNDIPSLDGLATYLWCYVGKLTARQARGVQAKLDLDLKKGFEEEYRWDELGRYRFIIAITEGLNWNSFKFTPVQHFQIHYNAGLVAQSHSDKKKIVNPKTDVSSRIPQSARSFVHLLPLSTLTDIWHRVGCPKDVESVRYTAIVWIRKTLREEKISQIEQKADPEEVELVFKLSLDDQEMTEYQREVLRKCIDIANRIRGIDDCNNFNIENKYGLALDNIVVAPPSVPEGQPTTKPSEQIAESVAPTKTKKKQVKSANSKPQNPTDGAINDALWTFIRKNKEAAKNYSAERFADELRSQKKNPIKKCTASAIKATRMWKEHIMPLRRREKTISLDACGNTRDDRAKDPSEILAEQSETDQD